MQLSSLEQTALATVSTLSLMTLTQERVNPGSGRPTNVRRAKEGQLKTQSWLTGFSATEGHNYRHDTKCIEKIDHQVSSFLRISHTTYLVYIFLLMSVAM